MKHLLFLAAVALLTWSAQAQTTVTLTVDMSNEEVSPEGVHVAGSFQGWNPGATPLTDNGDGTWSYAFTSDTAAAYQYKFINGNAWGFDEGIPAACAFDGNRQLEVDGLPGEVMSTVCYNSCAACGLNTVRFRVDMSNEAVSPFGVHVAGDFQGWDPDAIELTDPDGDMVYEVIQSFEADSGTSIAFKFINGNAWTDVTEFIPGSCGDGSGNRLLTIEEENMMLSANAAGDAFCFGECASCVAPLQVTFTVDMSVVSSVSEQGVHLAGSFQGWDAESTMLSDNGDGTWSTTIEVSPGSHQFKFINGAGWNGGEENMNGTSCNAGGHRGAEFDAENNTYEACFNACPGESCLPDPDPANLTFQVDASEVDMAGEAMYVFGAFTGWQGGAIEMTNMGGGIWETTQLVSGSAKVDYKYSIGYPSNEGNDESGEFISLGGDSTTFAASGCGIGNGFGGYNRRFERSGMDEVIPLHCFNRCVACVDDGVIFYESFANGLAGTNSNGAWTVADNQDGNLWIWVAPNGQGQYWDGTPTGSTHPGGVYSTNIGALESTTASDGWMIFDNDFWHGGEIDGNNPAFDTEGSLTSPTLDFSNNGSVIVTWESYFRYCCRNDSPLFLEVGVTENDVTTWTTFDAHGDFIESANAASANPLTVSVDVSCVAAYKEAVQLRFAYRQAPETGQGYSHYFWGIDDVVVSSNNVANDVEITQVTNGDVFGVWEYRLTPFEQAIGAADGGLIAGVMYKNVGTATQYDVEVLVEILADDSVPIWSYTEIIDTLWSSAEAPQCPANSQDTLYVETGWQPDAIGKYSLRASLITMDDATPLNNVLAKDFFYTADVYGHDDDGVLDLELGPRENQDLAGLFDPTGYGSFYHCPNPGSVAYGLAVKFGPNTGLNVSGDVEPFEFATRLYTLDGSATITDSDFDETYWQFNTPPNPTGDPNVETYLAFDDPIDLGMWNPEAGGNYYFAGIISEFESAAQLTVLAEPNSDTDNSTGSYEQTGDGDFIWFTSKASTPAIRLITAPFVAGCTDQTACNYDLFAGVSDGSCLFVGQPCNDGLFSTFNDVVDEDCQCRGEALTDGCTDPVACNYDSEADIDDGSCCICIDENEAPQLVGEWRLSNEAGGIALGPEPGSMEWYSSPAGGLPQYQEDDRWSFSESGEFAYNNNGGTMNPFEGYVETLMTVEPSTYTLEAGAGFNGEDLFTINGLVSDYLDDMCGWMGVWDSGPTYTIVALTHNRMVLSAMRQGYDCTNDGMGGYWTLTFERSYGAYNNCPTAGCTDPEAYNYDPEATVDDGTCVYFVPSCEFIGHPEWEGYEAGLYSDSTLWHYQGTEAYGEWALHMPELIVEPASGTSFAVMEWSNLTMANLPPGLHPENLPSQMTGGEQVCVSYSGVPTEVGLYPVLVSGELTVTLFGNPYVVGPYNVVGTIEVLDNPNPIPGCTYGNAANYVVFANVDDGSCVFAGCTEVEACNYQPLATVDDGTCDFGVCEALCPADVNGDGIVNTTDLLGLLGYFGLPCEE